MKSSSFLLMFFLAIAGCGGGHDAGVADGVEPPPEIQTPEFEKGERQQAIPVRE